MKKGINLWAFPEAAPYVERIRIAKSAGFEGIELNMEEQGYLTPQSSRAEVERLRDTAREHGMEMTSLCTGLFWKYSLTSDTESERTAAMATVRRMVEVASWLEVAKILVVPGAVENPFTSPVPSPIPYDVAYTRSLNALKELAVVAAENKVHIGIENVWNKFLLSPLEFRHLIDEVGSPFVGAYFDVGNVLALGYPEQWIRILGKRIRQVHVKDFKKSGMHAGVFVGLLEGDVDWRAVREALQSIGYDGYVVAEFMPLRIHPEQRIVQTARAMAALFQETE